MYANGRLAMRVFELNLDPALKLTAVAMALFAGPDGGNIFPSVERIAWMVGSSARTVQRHFDKLRKLGVLIPRSSLRGGRRRPSEYQLELPFPLQRPSWMQEKLRQAADVVSVELQKQRHSCDVVSSERVTPVTETTTLVTETTTPVTEKGDTAMSPDLYREEIEEEREEQCAPAAFVAYQDSADQPAQRPHGAEPPRLSFLELVEAQNPAFAASFKRLSQRRAI